MSGPADDGATARPAPPGGREPVIRPTADEVAARLREAFPDARIDVVDDSHRHAGHAGAAGGAGHYTVDIASVAFHELKPIARHRLVYDALTDWMPHRVHALSIRASLPQGD